MLYTLPSDLSAKHLKKFFIDKKSLVSLVYRHKKTTEILAAIAWNDRGREIKTEAAVGVPKR